MITKFFIRRFSLNSTQLSFLKQFSLCNTYKEISFKIFSESSLCVEAHKCLRNLEFRTSSNCFYLITKNYSIISFFAPLVVPAFCMPINFRELKYFRNIQLFAISFAYVLLLSRCTSVQTFLTALDVSSYSHEPRRQMYFADQNKRSDNIISWTEQRLNSPTQLNISAFSWNIFFLSLKLVAECLLLKW